MRQASATPADTEDIGILDGGADPDFFLHTEQMLDFAVPKIEVREVTVVLRYFEAPESDVVPGARTLSTVGRLLKPDIKWTSEEIQLTERRFWVGAVEEHRVHSANIIT